MIICIPPYTQRKKSAVDEREKTRVLEWLEKNITPDQPQPLGIVECIASKVMLDRFGYGSTVGKIRTLATLQALEKDGKIQIRTGAIEIVPPPPPIPAPVKPQPTPMPKIELIKRGPAHCRTNGHIIGDRNERRFHRIALKLLNLLIVVIPGVINGTASQSGRHNPRKGKIDLRDHQGSDVDLRLTIRDVSSSKELWLIYDVKSSKERAKKFNKSIRIWPSQKAAYLKRAIVVNKTRTDRSIAQEVLNDLVAAFLMSEYQLILEHFDD